MQVHLTAGPSKERARGGLGDVVEGGLEWRRSLDWRGRHTAVCLIGTSTQDASEGGVRQGLPQVLTGGRVRGKRVFYRCPGCFDRLKGEIMPKVGRKREEESQLDRGRRRIGRGRREKDRGREREVGECGLVSAQEKIICRVCRWVVAAGEIESSTCLVPGPSVMPAAPDENVTGGRKVQPPRRLHSPARRPWFSGPKVIRSPPTGSIWLGISDLSFIRSSCCRPVLWPAVLAAGLAGTFGSSTL